MIGELAVYDHWRQRVTLLANVIVGDDTDLRAAYDDASRPGRISWRPTALVPSTSRSCRCRDRRRPAARGHCRRWARPSRTAHAVEAAREYIFAGDIFQVVLAQRFELDPRGRCLRPLPRAAAGQPEPVHVLPAARRRSRWSGARRNRWCSSSRGDRSSPVRSPGPASEGTTEEDDRRLAAELVEHPKERSPST